MHECRIEHKINFYETICKWWDGRKFPRLPYECLPSMIFVVSFEGKDVYAMPVYTTDTNTCFIGFVTGSHDSTKEERKEALSSLTKFVESYMKMLGISVVITSTASTHLKKLFEAEGYKKTGENYNEYLKIL
jgi:hypothetical protein